MLFKWLLRRDKLWFKKNYNSRRGFLLITGHKLRYIFGRFNQYKKVDWTSVERLVFVCKGNICRSAFAEAVSLSLGIEAVSCGLEAIENEPANGVAILTAESLGYNLKNHKTKPIMYAAFKKTDLIVTMEPCQADFLVENMAIKQQCTLLGLWSDPPIPYIHDPYGGSAAYFTNCFQNIEKSVYGIAEKISKTN